MDAAVREFIGLGVAGAVTVLLMLGWLIPKWVVDEYRKREATKDKIIEKLTDALQRLADKAEARAAVREADRDEGVD